uniref:Uncharacterized protein n=1 Tax=Corethron hystrix TaxID=216773 RepID=A0A7S1BTG9_9STRA|mmetsp:Transcript_38580/g.89667  ORF Transcript_38580/g.89667 Transcript_38580/m.89667 type:complete len:104 (+) Transcript_38580:165-476(+)
MYQPKGYNMKSSLTKSKIYEVPRKPVITNTVGRRAESKNNFSSAQNAAQQRVNQYLARTNNVTKAERHKSQKLQTKKRVDEKSSINNKKSTRRDVFRRLGARN